jgi:hypothetical protein
VDELVLGVGMDKTLAVVERTGRRGEMALGANPFDESGDGRSEGGRRPRWGCGESATGAFGAVWSQAELRKVLAATGARVVEGEVAVGHAPTRFDEDGRLVDENLLEQLEEVVAGLIASAAARSEALDSPLASAA